MSDTVIRAESLGKKYRIGALHKKHDTLRDSIASAFKRPNVQTRQCSTDNEFWALKDVSFEVKQGEVVGVIGRNGAGKSTLLKILSKITEPTAGRVELRGRVGSLLEVGTGFHPELTGRENIFLNGAILGMGRAEIRRRFDEMVAFAEVEKFIDTPVKHYSSGMYMRLAFAVAAHLEPEILLVDEVLSVGDALFQKKCLGKMSEVSRQGRTVIFVSHNMGAVSSLCTKGILLENGTLTATGEIEEVISRYLILNAGEIKQAWSGQAGDGHLSLLRTWIQPKDAQRTFHTSSPLEIGCEVYVHQKIHGLIAGFTLFSEYDYEIAYVVHDDDKLPPALEALPGTYTFKWVIPSNTLAAGMYRIEFDIGIHMDRRIIKQDGSLLFNLDNTDGLGRRYPLVNRKGWTSLFRPFWSVGS